MSMRPLALAAALAFGLASPALARPSDVEVDGPGDRDGCEAYQVRFDGAAAVRGTQTLAVPGGTPFRLHAPSSAGLRVRGWERPDFEVTACKAARDAAALAEVSVEARGGVVTVAGADGEDVHVFLLVRAPKGADLDLAAENGPMTLRDLSANVKARAENGPVALASVDGRVEVEAVNGPLSFRDASGDWTLAVTNGPLSARLSGTRWEGKGLVARTVNGPLTLKVDPRFASGLRVSAASHAPLTCRAAACAGARRSDDTDDDEGERFVELGSGEPVVRLSTVNGPVTIRDDA
jgi:hypothetical protein